MESENVHYHQEQLVGSSSLPISSCYGVASTHFWTPNSPGFTLNNSEFNPNYNGILASPSNSSMIQDWRTSSNEGSFNGRQSNHELHFGKIKEEFSESLTRLTDMLTQTNSGVGDSQKHMHDLSEKLLLKTISSGFPMFPAGGFYSHTQNCSIPRPSRGSFSFSQIYPSINISNLNQTSSANISSSYDMNMEELDLLNPTRFNMSSCFNQPSSHDHHNLGLHHQHMHQSNQRAACSPSKILSPFPSEITEANRATTLPEPEATSAGTAKKSRLDLRASCPPLKVRKEKMGDRIAALQQMVAPFGKTDTASVLMEAIGYIKFLQNQVEVLSVPYMKSSRNKISKFNQGGITMMEGNEPKRDLRSRGLCLVPLSCMSYVTNCSGGGIWPPPNFGGRT